MRKPTLFVKTAGLSVDKTGRSWLKSRDQPCTGPVVPPPPDPPVPPVPPVAGGVVVVWHVMGKTTSGKVVVAPLAPVAMPVSVRESPRVV